MARCANGSAAPPDEESDTADRERRPIALSDGLGCPWIEPDHIGLVVVADRAGFRRVPQVGDRFVSRGPPEGDNWYIPCCVEYTDKIPNGQKMGKLRKGSLFVAKEIDVVMFPPYHGSDVWELGIGVRTESVSFPGRMCWINVCRGRTMFARLLG